jgi:hypothetical protein
MTFGTACDDVGRVAFTTMETISTIVYIAAITCGLALVGILWREAERADEEVRART